jgi:hypothetical protein
VLYLFHGGDEDDTGWSVIGRAGFILAKLPAEGKITPLIIVVPNGKLELPGFSYRGSKIDFSTPERVASLIQTIIKPHDAFAQDLFTGIIPVVENSCDKRPRPPGYRWANYGQGADDAHRSIKSG